MGDKLLHLANLLSSLGVNSGNINISLACMLLDLCQKKDMGSAMIRPCFTCSQSLQITWQFLTST